MRTKWLLLFFLSLVWGSSFILIKRGLVALSPFQVGSLRIVFAAIFLLPFGFSALPKIGLDKWKFIIVSAFIGTFFPAFLFALAQMEISSTVSAVLNSLTPLNTLLVGLIAFGIGAQRRQIFGVFIGLAGTLILILSGAANHPNHNYYYAILVLIASICYAINVNLVKKYLSDVKPLAIVTGNFAVLLIPALIVLSTTNFFSITGDANVRHALIFVSILGFVGTGIANILFFKLIQISSPVFATSVTYLIPVVAFFWGMLDGEMLTPIQFGGALVILIGVYMSSKK